MLLTHIVNFHFGQRTVGQRSLNCKPRIICMHMNLHNVVIRYNYDRIADGFQKRLKVKLCILCVLFFEHNDKFCTVTEFNISCRNL